MGLKLDVRPGDTVTIGDGIELVMEEKSGQIARLSFDAPKDVPIRLKQSSSRVAGIAAELGLGSRKKY